MVINTKRIFAVILFSLFAMCLLVAQQTSASYIDTRYIQRLTWIGDEYATKYEVVIEQEVPAEETHIEAQNVTNLAEQATEPMPQFTFAAREFTENEYIEISLSPGNYRFRVIPYDFRDLPEAGTDWKSFVILSAPLPEITFDEALAVDDASTEEAIFDDEASTQAEDSITDDASTSESAHDETLDETNEATLEAITPNETLPAEIDNSKPVDFFVSAFYTPSFPLYENISADLHLSEPSILGAALRLGILFTKPTFITPGIELAARWHTINNETDKYDVDAGLNLLLQKRMSNGKTALAFRAGAGITAFSVPSKDSSFEEWIYANIGLSFVWNPLKHFYLEIGFDHIHHFTKPLPQGNFHPFIGIGTCL